MTPADHLMLDAKQALLEDQHKQFQQLQKEGHWREAMHKFQATLHCASDLLDYSLQVLEQAVHEQKMRNGQDPPPPAAPSTT